MQDDNYSGLFYKTALAKCRLPLWWWTAAILAAGLLSFCITRFALDTTNHTDPAISALKQTGYTNIYLLGVRKGICGADQDIVYALIVADSVPKIERKSSYDKSCFFVDRFVAKDSKGVVQTGTVSCGPVVKLIPPFVDCNIFDDVTINEGETDKENQTVATQGLDI